jgi:ABC-type oligopeptide transport system substrate-binding subunit
MANDTIVIQYFKYPQTSYGLFQSGQADILTGTPPDYFPLIKQQVAIGQASIYEFPSLSDNMLYLAGWWGPGMFNETDMKLSFGSQYHMPVTYFLNLDVRKAFAYAFDYNYFLDEILGNERYGVDFGSGIAGAGNMQGMPYSVPESELQNVPVYNLTYAKQLLEESGEYNTSIDIPFAIPPCYTCYGMGNKTEFAMVEMYAAAIHSIDPNIVITPVADNSSAPAYVSYPIRVTGSIADYPAQSDVVDILYQDPDTPGWLNSSGYPDQAATFTQINALIQQADSTTNATLAAQDYKQMEQLAINLYLYVYLDQQNSIYVVKPYMNGYQGQISYVMNPMGWYVIEYVWWVKTCGSIQACSGRGIGP